ncbi:CBS domain-containing protein [Methanolobus sp. WCC4]|uniref:CBS domain-containing protein n=1 Tax=Methanolobus sp. WCC4 TaxID=3125784 RepID=UPI0030F6ED7F
MNRDETTEKTDVRKEAEDSPRDRTRLSDACAEVVVSDVMSEETIIVRDNDPIEDIIELMTRTPYHSYPVLNSDNELVGIIGQDNILELLFFERSHRHHHTHLMAIKALSEDASTLMVHHPVTISPDATLCDAVDLIIKHHIDRLYVSRDKELVGVISRSDIIRKIHEMRRQ